MPEIKKGCPWYIRNGRIPEGWKVVKVRLMKELTASNVPTEGLLRNGLWDWKWQTWGRGKAGVHERVSSWGYQEDQAGK